jgi:hypothetical protein
MNSVSTLWEAIRKYLEDNKTTIGILTAERAEVGKATTTKTPGCLVWLEFESAVVASGGAGISLPINISVFCLASAQHKSVSAIDAALDVATNVVSALADKTISTCAIELSSEPIEVIDSSSTSAVVVVQFKTKVNL